jgi:Flp pilus assembly protein TadG
MLTRRPTLRRNYMPVRSANFAALDGPRIGIYTRDAYGTPENPNSRLLGAACASAARKEWFVTGALFPRSLLRKLLREESGQTIVLMAFGMFSFIGMAGIAIETGHCYYAYERLVASTNAATLAGAQGLPDTATASANATAYSSAPGGMNATPLLTNVNVTPTFLCLATVTNSLKTPCESSGGDSGGYNAIQVHQTAQVPAWLAELFGVKTFHLSATSTAAMRGGTASTWNIAIVLDTTGSMGDRDSGKQCSGTQISCALLGVQALLGDLYPCELGQNCPSSDTYVDDVSLYVFPPVLASTASQDYCSGGRGNPTHEYYEVPALPSTWTYQIVPYSNDYRMTDEATGLNTSSDIVIAAGGSNSCTGIQAPGGAGTYYAQVIYQAQSDLLAQQTANPGSRDAMIVLSDGDATATVTYNSNSGGGSGHHGGYSGRGGSGSGSSSETVSSTSDLQPSSTDSLNGIEDNNPDSYTYPSAVGECGQAVVAAQAAANAGTLVYTIGYGAETSGCTTDSSYSASVTTNGGSWGPGDSPCQALEAMASAPINFFSDDSDGCKATVPSNQAITQLTSIFHQITASLSTPRLIPNGTA